MDNKVEFKAKLKRCIYNTDSFKVYAMDVNKEKYPNIHVNSYNNVTIIGDLPELTEDVEYEISATEKEGKYGLSYNVCNIKRNIPTTKEGTYSFLSSILTENQAIELMNTYPDIIDRIKNNNLEDIDLSKLNGIGEKTFEKIKQKIIDNFYLADLIAEFQGYFTLSIVRKLYKEYSSIETMKERLEKEPYDALTRISGVGFKTADMLLLDIEKISNENKLKGKSPIINFNFSLISSPQRCLACIIYLLKENENNGNTKMNLVDLRTECQMLVPECMVHFVDVIKNENIYYDKDSLEIALKYTYNTEKYICDNIYDRINNKPYVWDYNIEKYRNVNGINLSDEQMRLLKSVCENNVTMLTAPAGSGKSFSTKALINMLKDHMKTFIQCCPTGKAAKKLSQYTGEKANTIHRTLLYQDGNFVYNENYQLNADLILIDEIGMTDIKLFKALLSAIKPNTRIVLIGDSYQLNSIGCGALLRDLIKCRDISDITFSKIFRMNEGGVLTACTLVRENKKCLTKNVFTQVGEDKSYSFIPSTKENMNKMVVALYEKLLLSNNAKDITVISSYNVGENGCDKLNQLLQPIANPSSKTTNNFIKVKQDKLEIKYCIGDNVIQNSNNYHAKLFVNNNKTDMECFIPNGEQGVIVDIINDDLIINFDDVIVYYSTNEIRQIKHAFALSTHKMQGSQNKIIIFCCPSSHLYMLSNNIIYTAISRAESKVFHFSDVKTINIAMNKSDSDKRKTFLGDMLEQRHKENVNLIQKNA